MNDAKVVFDYDAEADDELTLKEGDIIKDIIKKEDGWWEGELYGRRGMFPENFVEEIKKQPIINAEKEADNAIPAGSFTEKNKMAKVTFDYDAENEDELTLKEGDVVQVLSQEEEGWWRGELKGKTGVFPTNFVEIITEKNDMTLNLQDNQVVEEKPVAAKKTTPVTGGIGFGALLTQDALSGIKLKKNKSDPVKIPAKTSNKTEGTSELSAKLSAIRAPPDIPQPPKAKQAKAIERAIVEHDYNGNMDDELTLKKGDIINILEKDVTEGWWKGELNGKTGLFPDNFVRLLTADEVEKDTVSFVKTPEMPIKKPTTIGDAVENKPSRPELPKQKPTTDQKPVVNRSPKKPENDIKSDEKKPPVKKSPPLLPKKPSKPKPPINDKPPKEGIADKPQVELRKWNGKTTDPTKRYSEVPRPNEFPLQDKLKRHSSGSDVLNFNDIKETQPLQPLTNNRPKNPAKNPPSKWQERSGGSMRRATTPERKTEPEGSNENKPPESVKPLEKPKKPGLPDHNSTPLLQTPSKPSAGTETTTIDVDLIKKLEKQVDILKKSLDSITKEFREYAQKSENRIKGLEKKMVDEIEDLTREVDEEKKARSALDVEVNRLRKLIKNQAP